jgi:hypothetical protein
MMVREWTSTSYVLFCIVVAPAIDPKGLFVEHVTMQSTWLIWVGLVK